MSERVLAVGLDIGTTSTKAIVVDTESLAVLVSTSLPTPVEPSGSGDMRRSSAVVEAAKQTVAASLSELGADERAAIRSLGVASLGEEVYLVDRFAAPLAPSPSWYNTGVAVPGSDVDPTLSWHKLAWLSANRAALGIRDEDVAGFTSLSGVVASSLSEPIADRVTIDETHASRTGFYDPVGRCWHPELLVEAGWPASTFPTVVSPLSHAQPISARLASDWGLPTGVTVTSAGHDHLCAGYAAGARNAGDMFLSAGTAEAHVLLFHGPGSAAELPSGIALGRHVTGDLYLHAQLAAGRIHQQWSGLLAPASASTESAAPDPSLLALVGTGTQTGVDLLGVTAGTRPEQVLAAITDGIAFTARRVDETLARLGGVTVASMIAAGPPTHDARWRLARAELAIAPISVSSLKEPTAVGAALISAAARGLPSATPRREGLHAAPAWAAGFRALTAALERAHGRRTDT